MVLVAVGLVGCEPTRLDEDLCPVGVPLARQTLLLVDTSDPLTAKHREVLRRLVSETQDTSTTGEALVVYKLSRDTEAIKPVLRVCNPGGNPEEWSWRDDLTAGKAIAERRWRMFIDRVEPLFPEAQGDPQPRSPILETLGVVVPRHVPSRRRQDGLQTVARTHLILYSDLLQHSPALSHYGPYLPADAIKSTPALRHLQTDLSGVEVSLYRLERARDSRWQTADHYYWWTELVAALGGQVIWQESV